MVSSWEVAGDLPPLDARSLLHDVHEALVRLLEELPDDAWTVPTINARWNVHDLALHLLGDDLSWLSAHRDPPHQRAAPVIEDFAELAEAIEAANDRWVEAAKPILSPQLTVELLRFVGAGLDDFMAQLDLACEGPSVGWSGTGSSPVWLHIGREYTERWMHQQQIRDAVGRPGLTERKWLHPVLDLFMRAMPRAFEEISAAVGIEVEVTIVGPAGGTWVVRRGASRWHLAAGPAEDPAAVVRMPQDLGWRLFCRNLAVELALSSIQTIGDGRLAVAACRAVAVMTTEN
jgi:uncharacterized protein (TIGR03083 family)